MNPENEFAQLDFKINAANGPSASCSVSFSVLMSCLTRVFPYILNYLITTKKSALVFL